MKKKKKKEKNEWHLLMQKVNQMDHKKLIDSSLHFKMSHLCQFTRPHKMNPLQPELEHNSNCVSSTF